MKKDKFKDKLAELHLMRLDLKSKQTLKVKDPHDFLEKFCKIIFKSNQIVHAEYNKEYDMIYIAVADNREQLAIIGNPTGLIYPLMIGLAVLQADQESHSYNKKLGFQDVWKEIQSDIKRE